ncbi:MAG: response regulator [Candidatus Heimdallarchaeota archaeon]
MSSNGFIRSEVKILIIDDDADIRDVFEEVLKRNNYTNVRGVGTGEEAKKIIAEEAFNIALIDLNLPDIYGMDLVSQFRTISPDIEFIIITGFGTIDSAIKSMQFEVAGYLEKPVSSNKLVSTLDEVNRKITLKVQNQKFLRDIEIANNEIRFLNDLLINNVDELNQSLLLTMVQIEKLNPSSEQTKVLQLFQESIRKNARLTRNIRKCETIKTDQQLESKDLNVTINSVLNRLKEDYSTKNFECICELSEPKYVYANNNLTHLISEIVLLALFNSPSPRIKIKIDFDEVELNGKNYWKLTFNSFQAKLVYDQKDVIHSSELKASTTKLSFQGLGPYAVNEIIRSYNGIVSIPEGSTSNNILEISLLKVTKD